MRKIPPDLQAALDSGATRLARCWKLLRGDGVAMGFTDHDRVLSFDGLDYEPESGFTPSAIEAGTGLAADTQEVAGALSSTRITEADIAKGLYDRAQVTLYLVDWSNPAIRIVQSRGLIGELRREATAFYAEITGLSDLLSQPVGRAFQHSCACQMGDGTCGVDPASPQFTTSGSVQAVGGPAQFTADGISGFTDGWSSATNRL